MTPLQGLPPLGQAMANAEGYGVPGALPTINNNPGDLTGSDGNLLSFGSITGGVSALQSQINAMLNGSSKYYNPNMTIAQVGQLYANGDPAWSSNVANYLGVPETTPIGQIPNTPTNSTPTTNASLIPSWMKPALPGTDSFSWFFTGRVAIFIIGIILIAAGVFSFKTTTDVINGTTKTVKKGAKIYATI